MIACRRGVDSVYINPCDIPSDFKAISIFKSVSIGYGIGRAVLIDNGYDRIRAKPPSILQTYDSSQGFAAVNGHIGVPTIEWVIDYCNTISSV